MFNRYVEPCPDCDRNRYQIHNREFDELPDIRWCETCDRKGVILSWEGRELLAFLDRFWKDVR